MSTVITGALLDVYQVIRVAHALSIEVNTDLSMSRGSVMNLAKSYCGSPKRTKRGVLIDYVEWLKEVLPDYEPSGTIVKAMAKPAK
jgi:hypothetical protein